MNMDLPRTNGVQIRNDRHIAENALKPGDLVFFKTSSLSIQRLNDKTKATFSFYSTPLLS